MGIRREDKIKKQLLPQKDLLVQQNQQPLANRSTQSIS